MEINNAVYTRPVPVAAKSVSDMDGVKGIPSKEVTPLTAAEKQSDAAQDEAKEKDIAAVVANLNEFAQTVRRDLSFSMQNDTGKVVVEVTESTTGELIRKIPSEEALELSERIADVRSLMTSVKA